MTKRGENESGPRVLVNGTPRLLLARCLDDLLRELGHEPGRRGLAVAVNDEVVPRDRWSSLELSPEDRIEIVEAVQGG